MALFQDIGILPWMCDVLKKLSITTPTKIQSLAIPTILEGKDVCGNSKTGTGKTAAFALPIIQKLSQDPYGVFALVVSPTRELALQIGQQFQAFGSPVDVQCCIAVGGLMYGQQFQGLSKQPHIVVGTPGRLLDFLRPEHFRVHFRRLKFLVIDEADRLLDVQNMEVMKELTSYLPTERQTLFFSATISNPMKKNKCALLKSISTKDEVQIVNAEDGDQPSFYSSVPKKLRQTYIWLPEHAKPSYLVHLLDPSFRRAKSVIVFCTSRIQAEELALMLYCLEMTVVAITSLSSQEQRYENLNRFRSGQCRVLVSTDLSSRGLDIPTVDLVINYAMPTHPKDYIHRVGRTARAGKMGKAITLVGPRDVEMVKLVENKIGQKLSEEPYIESEVLSIMTPVAQALLKAKRMFDDNYGDVISQKKESVTALPIKRESNYEKENKTSSKKKNKKRKKVKQNE